MSLIQLFRRIAPYVRPYKWYLFVALALTFVGSLTAQVNAWVLREAVDRVNGLVVDHRTLADGLNILTLISAVLIGKEILNFFIQYGQKYYGERLRIYIARDLAQQVVDRILSYRLAFFTTAGNRAGKMQMRIERGIESLTRMIQNFFIDILPLFANSVVALIVMFNANIYVGSVGLSIIPIYFYISWLQATKLRGSRRRIKDLRENKSQGILTILDSITVIKSFIRENIESNKQMALQNSLTDTQLKTRRLRFLFEGAKGFVEQFGVVAIIILTVWLVLKGQMTIGAIMFHIMLFNNVTAPIRQLHRIYDEMNDALIYSESFFEVLDADSQVEDSGDYKPVSIRGHFEVRDVDFTYPGNELRTLTGIDMEICPGKITALVGLSGAGKSTLINLLDKFYRPDSGEILLDGVPLEKYGTAWLRDHIGLVLQKNHIFNGTVAENIRYGNPEATEDEVVAAARQAYIHDQIEAMPEGYETSALSLSGGQQQKISIARMFLKNPPIIFLDEPTASLDALSTEQIKRSLDAIKQNRTVVIISHSISQIIDSDRMYVMKDGRVVEGGTHEELYRMNGTYREIFDAMARSMNIEKISHLM